MPNFSRLTTFTPNFNACGAVGSSNGEITLWDLGLRERLVSKPFKIWDMAACSLAFQVLMFPLVILWFGIHFFILLLNTCI